MILTQVMRFSSYLLAALAIYYGCVYESPDKTALSLLAAIASIGLYCLCNAELMLYALISRIHNTSNILEEIMQQNNE